MLEKKQQKRYRRHKAIRARIQGVTDRPRLCVFRSGKHIYAQLINGADGKILVSGNDNGITKKALSSAVKGSGAEKNTLEKDKKLAGKIAKAYQVGRLIAKLSLEKKIEYIVFDRGGYKYHGRVKAVAEGARDGGLKF